MEHKTGRGLR